MRNQRSATALASAAFLVASGAGLTLATPAHAGTPGGTYANDRNSDFNGDGHEDLVIAAPGATVNGKFAAGHVTVRYGSALGPGTGPAVRISQATPGVPGSPEHQDGFGKLLATGDLNADGHDELIVGIPDEDLYGLRSAGGVTVLWGGPTGLARSATWVEAREPIGGSQFGRAIAAARFSAAHPGDLLVVGDNQIEAGSALELLRWKAVPQPTGGVPGDGTPGGIAPMDAAASGPDTVRPGAEPVSRTGLSGNSRHVVPTDLTTGDYNRDGLADLVVTGPGTGSPALSAYYEGGPRGPMSVRVMSGGLVAASGDIDGDGYDDLVHGLPDHLGNPGPNNGGRIGVRYGGPDGPAVRPQVWSQDSPGVAGVSEPGDGFGGDLSVADADGDGYADVAVGAPAEDVGGVLDAGAVWVLRGSVTGLTGRGGSHWNQDSRGVPGRPEKADQWGSQVRFTGPDRYGRYALVAAAPGENLTTGRVWLLPASRGGATSVGSSVFGAGAPATGTSRFGAAIDE
ncbi:FG-GAP and VCBS repeat-containing protein [Streptomyces sp. JNUCC 64]